MLRSSRNIVRRFRRSVAQRGLKNVIRNVWRRVTRGRRSNAALMVDGVQQTIIPGPQKHPFDEQFGVDTSGTVTWEELETGHAHDIYVTCYYGVAPSLFHGVIERWQSLAGKHSIADCTFIDLGSGKGRPVLLAAELPFKASIGVELNPALSDVLRQNIVLWEAAGKAKGSMAAICQDATEFVFPENPCVLYMFNPFTAQVLKKVIANIARVFAKRPGELEVLYLNAEFSSLFAEHPGFELRWEGRVFMSPEDAAFDLAHQLADQGEVYGESGSEFCSIWRWKGMPG
jgi:SAM-dependent methyltransferase